VGQSKADARATLTDAGFKVKVVEQDSADQPEGTVLRQSPSTGKQDKGSTVTIFVAVPPPGTGGAGPGSTTTTPTPAPGTVP
jgi:serine/threonine-protein kinase